MRASASAGEKRAREKKIKIEGRIGSDWMGSSSRGVEPQNTLNRPKPDFTTDDTDFTDNLGCSPLFNSVRQRDERRFNRRKRK